MSQNMNSETVTLFEVLDEGDVVFQNQEQNIVITKLKREPFTLFKMWKHIGDGNFNYLDEYSMDDLFRDWVQSISENNSSQ